MNSYQTTDDVVADQLTQFYGKYRGIVSKNQDPKNMGRIKATVPEILHDVETGWALPCVPYTGAGTGTYAVPEVDAGVWIEFEAGDVSRPIWSGCWWGEQKVPVDNAGKMATPSMKIIHSEKGLMVCLDDDGQTISVSDKTGTNMMTIKVQEGQIKIQSSSNITIESPKIDLVERARHPVVYGDNLMNYLKIVKEIFDNHLHPSDLCLGMFPIVPDAPVPPLLEAQSTLLLSKKVSTG